MTKKPAVSLLNVAIQYTLSFYKHLSLYSNQPFSIEIGSNIELLLKLKSSIEIARIIAASAERELQ